MVTSLFIAQPVGEGNRLRNYPVTTFSLPAQEWGLHLSERASP
jgi:hypothetical protein